MAPNISYWQKASKNHKQLLEIVSSAKNDTKEHVQVAKKKKVTEKLSKWHQTALIGIVPLEMA